MTSWEYPREEKLNNEDKEKKKKENKLRKESHKMAVAFF